MKCKVLHVLLIILIIVIFFSVFAYTADKSIYIKTFVITQGIPVTDPIGERIKDYISEAILSKGGYTLTSDEEVMQVMTQESIKMSLDTCYDDVCIKKLMESLRTDFIIYGNVFFEDDRYHITGKMLDRTGGAVKLTRVKSLQFKDKNKLKMASVDLANYLAAGKEIDIARYDDAYQVEMEKYEKKVPVGLSVYYIYFKPSKTPFKTYYDSLMGGGLDYFFKIGDYFAAGAGLYYVLGDNKSGDITVSLNSYSITGRAGYPMFGMVYPYIGLFARATWFNEKGPDDSANYMGYGGDISAGCAVIIWRTLSVWADYSMSFVKLNDEGSTDISGSAIRGGVMYAF